MAGRNAGIDHFYWGTVKIYVLSVLDFGMISKLKSNFDAKMFKSRLASGHVPEILLFVFLLVECCHALILSCVAVAGFVPGFSVISFSPGQFLLFFMFLLQLFVILFVTCARRYKCTPGHLTTAH